MSLQFYYGERNALIFCAPLLTYKQRMLRYGAQRINTFHLTLANSKRLRVFLKTDVLQED